LIDGHPASSKLDLFESMVKKTVEHLRARPDLFAETALIVTFDEGRRLLRLRLHPSRWISSATARAFR